MASRLRPIFPTPSRSAPSSRVRLQLVVKHEKVHRDGPRRQLAQHRRQLTSVITRVIHDMVHLPPERVTLILEHQASPNAVRHKCLRQLPSDRVDRLPAGTVRRHDQCRAEFFEGSHRRRDDPLKERAGEMESADHGIQLLDSGQLLGVANRY